MTATATRCPRCGSVHTERHCSPVDYPDARCDLIRCTDCNGYGKPDGTKWAQVIGT